MLRGQLCSVSNIVERLFHRACWDYFRLMFSIVYIALLYEALGMPEIL